MLKASGRMLIAMLISLILSIVSWILEGLEKENNSSVMRQTSKFQNGGNKKTSHIKPRNKPFLPPDTHTYVCVSGGKKCLFFWKFGVFCFLVTSVLRFALLAPNIAYPSHFKFFSIPAALFVTLFLWLNVLLRYI